MTTADKVWLAAMLTPLVRHGDVGLAGGGRSDWYLDCRELTYGVDGPFLAEIIDRDLVSLQLDAAGGVGFGGLPIALHLAARRHIRSFAVRRELKGHGRVGRVLGPLHSGDQVALIEDVVTTGSSLCSAVEALGDVGVDVVTIVCLVNRGNPALRSLYGIPFTSLLTAADLGEA